MNPTKVAIVDAGLGNQSSILSALLQIGIVADRLQDSSKLGSYSHCILPGVGHFAEGVTRLKAGGFFEALQQHQGAGRPILGICLGFQMLSMGSEEAKDLLGLGLLPIRANGLPDQTALHGFQGRVPHMGFNSVRISSSSVLFKNIPNESDFYFTHSFAFLEELPSKFLVGSTKFGDLEFTSVVESEGIFGVQFHPERSQGYGLDLLRNFVSLC